MFATYFLNIKNIFMKKLILSITTIALLAAYSCSKDEETSSSSNCCTLSNTIQGSTITVKYCKKDDKTVTISTNGGTTTDVTSAMMLGMTADQFMAAQKTAGCK